MSEEIEYCPVVYPTQKEFSNFHEYVEKLEQRFAKDHGMIKVIPPKGWKARNADYEDSVKDRMICGPIEQNLSGKGGIYECLLIAKKSMPFSVYKKKSIQWNHITQDKTDRQVEDLFWKNIAFSPPLYGADLKDSLFDPGVKWNLNELDSLLKYGLKYKVSGINTPYLYIGCWKTLFCWHKEDMDLAAINFLHYGKPKFWYGICPGDRKILENFTKQYFADSFNKCNEHMRHKTTVINPYILKQRHKNLRVTKCCQKPGEFVIQFSNSYHCGFNYGYNIAEAVNYATFSWLDGFRNQTVNRCECQSGNVTIDSNEFIRNIFQNNNPISNSSEFKRIRQKQIDEGLLEDPNQQNTVEIINKDQISEQEFSQQGNIEKEDKQLTNKGLIKKKIQKVSNIKKEEVNKKIRENLHKSNSSCKNSMQTRNSTSSTNPNQVKQIVEGQQTQPLLSTPQAPTKTRSASSSQTKSKVDFCDWARCDQCNKWRKITNPTFLKGLSNKSFFCRSLPNTECQTPQESLKNLVTVKLNV